MAIFFKMHQHHVIFLFVLFSFYLPSHFSSIPTVFFFSFISGNLADFCFVLCVLIVNTCVHYSHKTLRYHTKLDYFPLRIYSVIAHPLPIVLLQVLQLLPDKWSVGLLSQFLTRAVRSSMHESRMTRIERMMSRVENLRCKETCIELQRDPVVMNEERYSY